MTKIRTVLVVDNNATVVELVSGHLVAAGYQVAKAYDGLQALDRLAETDQLPDVILLDLIMPRLDGERLTRFLKQDPLYSRHPRRDPDGDRARGRGRHPHLRRGRLHRQRPHRGHDDPRLRDLPLAREARPPERAAVGRPRHREALPARDDARAAPHQGAPEHDARDDAGGGGRDRPGPPHPLRQPGGLQHPRRGGQPPLRQGAAVLLPRRGRDRGLPGRHRLRRQEPRSRSRSSTASARCG